jgi:ElaB/YqjD/DUF883 family membrane-anchored ribosome-binding protein
MNPKPINDTEAIRSDIEMTRRRMDETMDALGERLQGRHLLDEIIGFFRHNSDQAGAAADRVKEKVSETTSQMRDKVTDAASNAGRAIADTVKRNPIPIALIGAGAAWLAYSAMKRRNEDQDAAGMYENEPYDPDTHYDRPIEYPAGSLAKMGEEAESSEASGESKLQDMKNAVSEKAAAAADQVKEKVSDLTDRARDRLQSVRARAGEMTERAKDRTRAAYYRTRDRVAQTADEHPLEIGLGCLAVGLLVGLALPTPAPVHRIAGPAVDRLRNRTRESGRQIMQKGQRVVRAAADAAKQEAEAQGLTLEQLRRRSGAVANRAGHAANDAAQREGLTNGQESPRPGNESADPSAAGPAM